LLPQLAALGYPAKNITYIAFSHYHFDHIANANAFAGSTWLVHAAERDAMFAASPKDQSAYSQLRHSKTVILPNTDYDVFGDGTVIIKSAPGHTPGHQVLALKLPKTGPVLIAGDLWHYAAERTALKAPEGEANKQQTLASRAAMEAYLKQSGAQLFFLTREKMLGAPFKPPFLGLEWDTPMPAATRPFIRKYCVSCGLSRRPRAGRAT
jgi:glyoxylase-like metal-dependent hydrolase (beta-lactamase superfamily II)